MAHGARKANPFAKYDRYTSRGIYIYRSLTILTWVLVVVFGVLHSFYNPDDLPTIWEVNEKYRTPFALNAVISGIYWTILLVLQLGYIHFLFTNEEELVVIAANVGSHFILNNLLQTAFILLWVRSRFWLSGLTQIVNFFNLQAMYIRHRHTPPFVHIPIVTGPLAWTFIALFWNGAVAVHAHTIVARILANVAVWSILLYGMIFVGWAKDYAMGFELSLLSAALAVQQFVIKQVALQWIFSFTIMAILFIATLLLTVPGFFGKEISFSREIEPLLSGEE